MLQDLIFQPYPTLHTFSVAVKIRKGCILQNGVSGVGEGITAIKTPMNINQNFLQTSIKKA
jgi:hypothetical protein